VPAGKKINEKRLKKEAYWAKLWKYLETYTKGLVVDADNVSSN
jgi:hypothetical protein